MNPTPINQADTAWMLVATALVLVMTPALGFFYGGLRQSEERTQYDDDELRRTRLRRHRVGDHRLLVRVFDRFELARRTG